MWIDWRVVRIPLPYLRKGTRVSAESITEAALVGGRERPAANPSERRPAD